jgi:Ca2+-binding RTX toxin-like protein
MAIYNVAFYNIDPIGLFNTTIGAVSSYTGPATADGAATITDSDGFIEQASTETATADVTLNATSSTGAVVYAEDSWTIRDTFTGEEFQVIALRVDSGDASGFYTLSEQPLISGRIYETVSYDSSPDLGAGDDVFTFADFATPDVGPLDGTVDGTSGNDIIDDTYIGDTQGDMVDNYDDISVVKTALDFNWDVAGVDGTDISAGVSQNTGGIQVDVSFVDTSAGSDTAFEVETTDTSYVDGGETFDPNSALSMVGSGGIGATSTTTIDFSANGGSGFEDYVTDVSFRLSGIDIGAWQDIVTITATGPDGSPVAVTLTPAGSDVISGTSAAPTVTASGGSDTTDSAQGSVLVSADGPLTQIVITYANGSAGGQSLNVTDIEFNAVDTPGGNQDVISGGDGNDVIDAGLASDTMFGDAGDDTLIAGVGDDTIFGGADADTIQLDDSFGTDSITGGETGTDQDVVDATNLTSGVTVNLTGSEAGTITDGVSTGTFDEIENFNLTALSDTYDGSASTADQTIIGNAGSDTITGGSGNDSISGGDDADFIFINDNFGSDNITSGEGGTDTDTLDASTLTSAINILLSGNEAGTATSAGSTATFAQVESFVLSDNADSFDGSASTTDGATVYGGGGGDVLTGGSAADAIFGGDSADLLDGGDGADVLDGGDGVDLLIGGQGDDTLTGGSDTDIFILADATGNDTIFGGETTTAGGFDDDIIDITSATNAIDLTFSGDEAGTLTNGAASAIFQDIEGFNLSSQDDTVDGSASSSSMTLFSGDGADTIIGSSTADLIDAGTGNDTIDAGGGDDTIFAGDDQDTIHLSDGYGTDSIDAGSGGTDEDTLDASTLTDAISILLSGDQAGAATSGANTATFTDVENFVLSAQDDTFDATAATTLGVTVDAGAGSDNILGTEFDDSISGGAGQDTINGGAGIDAIDAGDDADTIILTDGYEADVIFGGEGTSTGGIDHDTLDVSALPLAVNVILSADETGIINDGVDIATFSGIESFILTDGGDAFDGQLASTSGATVIGGLGIDSLIGTDADDSLTGDEGQDFIDGGTGADTITTGDDADAILLTDNFGNDTISGGEGTTSGGTDSDTLDASALSSGVDITLTADEAGTAILGADTATFDGIEEFILSSQADTFDGTAATTTGTSVNAGDGDDSITGTGVADRLLGGAGQDTIDGGTGIDTIDGGDDADTIVLSDGFGDDVISGGEFISTGTDFDTLDTSNLTTSVNVTLTIDEVGTAVSGGDTASYTGIEAYVLSDNDDTFDASASISSAISVDAGAGSDSILGTDLSDTLTGGAGQDTIEGSTGADTIDGGDDADLIILNDGFDNDIIAGGEGTSLGGVDEDTIDATSLSSGVDVTFSSDQTGIFTDGTDTASFTGIERFDLTASDDDFSAALDTAGATIYAGAGDDTIITGSGDDTLSGGTGADELTAGAGDDTLIFSVGDTASGGDGDDLFTVSPLIGASANITVTGGEGDEILGDTLNLQGRIFDPSDIVYGGGDNEAGTATLKDGTILTFSEIENIFICFAYGTNIMTNRGDLPIQSLKMGDKVITRDNGLKEIRWIGSRKIPITAETAPIVFQQGVVKNTRDLIVSPQHRMLFTGMQAELMFGQSEVLVPAKHLLGNDGVYQVVDGFVEYFHILFDRHEIIYAEGAASESYHPGDYSLAEIGEKSREEIFNIFPELRSAPNIYGQTARTCLKAHEGKLLYLN